jgi:type VI secretion system protein ImpG
MGSYFDREMRLLQETAQEFARAFPEKASQLNLLDLKDRDPYVERLLEGMAFLTAEVKQRIDDDLPEFAEALLGHIRPHFLRPFPSCCIMQFSPRPGQLQQTTVIDKNTSISSSTVTLPAQGTMTYDERIHCRFRTTSPVVLQPLRLSSVELATPVHGYQTMTLLFQFDHDVQPQRLDFSRLKLFLHGDQTTAMEVYQALTSQIDRVEIGFPGRVERPQRLGKQEVVHPCHLDADNILIPSSGREFLGFHLLHDYFCFREKYQFVELTHMEALTWPDGCSEFEVVFHLKTPLSDELRLTKDNFRLHCAPAINLFTSSSEPIHLDQKQTSYPVVANNNTPDGVMVYSVDQVTGSQIGSGTKTRYSALPQFNHRSTSQRYFQVSHRQQEGLRPRTCLSVGGEIGEQAEILSCDITACNANAPRDHLQVGDIKAPGQDFPSQVTAANITRPTRMFLPPDRPDYRLALVTHLTVSYNSLANAPALQQLLALYDWSDHPQSSQRIAGIQNIELAPLKRVHRGALLRGLDIRLHMEEKNYLSAADAFLFGTVLHHFFSMYVTINTFVQTGSSLSPSKRELQWDPLLGENFLI